MSVIVATYRREEDLCITLSQLIDQEYTSCEIIVVDQSYVHDKETEEYLKSVSKEIRYIRLDKPNLCYARNVGIEQSTGEIVLFVDDDVRVARDFVANHARNYDEPSIVSVVGQVLDARNPNPLNVQPEMKAYFFGRVKSVLHSNRRGLIDGGRGCNMSFRKEIFKDIGYFDENLSVRDETDIFMRIKARSAGEVIFEPRAGVYHLETRTGGTADLKKRSQESPGLITKVRNLSKQETLFHLKHFRKITVPVFSVYLLLLFAMKWNFPNIHKIISAGRAVICGIADGIRLYSEEYKH